MHAYTSHISVCFYEGFYIFYNRKEVILFTGQIIHEHRTLWPKWVWIKKRGDPELELLVDLEYIKGKEIGSHHKGLTLTTYLSP